MVWNKGLSKLEYLLKRGDIKPNSKRYKLLQHGRKRKEAMKKATIIIEE